MKRRDMAVGNPASFVTMPAAKPGAIMASRFAHDLPPGNVARD
jgi:hypothetical protein